MDFNIKAVNWDTEKRVKRAKIIADEIARAIDIKDNFQALEFGCGTGLISFNLLDKFGHITLVDTSKGMIDTLNSKIKEHCVKNMTTLNLDINDNPEALINKFDVIYTSMVLHHILDIKTTLQNLYGKLVDNGYLCIVDLVEDDGSFHKEEKDFNGHNGFNQNELKQVLKELGYRNVESKVFYNDVKVINDSEINYSLFIMVGQK